MNKFYVKSIGHDIRSSHFSQGWCCDTLTANDYKDPIRIEYAVNCRNNAITEQVNGTLQAKNSGGYSMNCNQVVLYENISKDNGQSVR